MERMLNNRVVVRELNYLCAPRDGAPEEVLYDGLLTQVKGHMIELRSCSIIQQRFSRRNPEVIWFNTMASTFQSIKPV